MRRNTIPPYSPSSTASSLNPELGDGRLVDILGHVRRLAADTYLLDTDLGCPILLDPASE